MKSKKCEIVNLHDEYFTLGNWMYEDLQKKNSNKNCSYEERSPEEIPEENFDSNKTQIKHMTTKKNSFNEQQMRSLNAYEMRENMPINPKKNNYISEEENINKEINAEIPTKEKPKHEFLKRNQKVLKQKKAEKSQKKQK